MQSTLKTASGNPISAIQTQRLPKRELVLMFGIPGSGKSTKARYDVSLINRNVGLPADTDPNFNEFGEDITFVSEDGSAYISRSRRSIRAYICSADNYPDLYMDDRINMSLLTSAHDWCQQSVIWCMENGHQIYLDNTNLKPEHWVSYLEIARNFGYTVRFLTPSNKLLFYNIEGVNHFDAQLEYLIRIRSHSSRMIPEKTIRNMYSQYMAVYKIIKNNKLLCGTNPNKWLQIVLNNC